MIGFSDENIIESIAVEIAHYNRSLARFLPTSEVEARSWVDPPGFLTREAAQQGNFDLIQSGTGRCYNLLKRICIKPHSDV